MKTAKLYFHYLIADILVNFARNTIISYSKAIFKFLALCSFLIKVHPYYRLCTEVVHGN